MRQLRFSKALLVGAIGICTALPLFAPAGQAYALVECVARPASMVSWWPAEGNANDRANSNNGTLQPGAGFAAGKVGRAFDVNSIGHVIVPDGNSLKLTKSLTVEGWIFVRGPGFILFRGDGRPGFDPYVLSVEENGRLQIAETDSNDPAELAFIQSSSSVPTNVWKHVAATLDDATGALRLYIDGVIVAQTVTTVRPLQDLDPNSGPSLGIGGHAVAYNFFPFTGLIDELSLYARALSQSEIQGIFNAGGAGKCVATGVQNGSFDTAGPTWPAPWILRKDLGATITRDGVIKHDGAYSARVDATRADPAAAYRTQLRQENRRLEAGKTYSLAFWARASTARPIEVKLQKAAAPFTSYLTRTVNLTTTWQQFAVRYTATISDANAFVGFNLAQATGSVWIDEVRLVDNNLIQNGSFEKTGTAWQTPWVFRHDVTATLIHDGATHAQGAFAAKVSVNTASPSAYRVQLRQENQPLIATRTYVIAFWAKASAARTIEVKLQQTTAPFISAYTKVVNLTTAWQQIVLIHTARTFEPNAFLGFNLANTAGQVWIDNASLAELP